MPLAAMTSPAVEDWKRCDEIVSARAPWSVFNSYGPEGGILAAISYRTASRNARQVWRTDRNVELKHHRAYLADERQEDLRDRMGLDLRVDAGR